MVVVRASHGASLPGSMVSTKSLNRSLTLAIELVGARVGGEEFSAC